MLKNCHFARGCFPVCVLKLLTSKFLNIVDIKGYQILIPICAKKETKNPNVNYVLLICVRWQHRWATQAATQLKDRRHPASPHQVSFSVTFFIPHFGWVIRLPQSSFSSHSSYLNSAFPGSQYYANYPSGSGQYDYGLQYGDTDRFGEIHFCCWVIFDWPLFGRPAKLDSENLFWENIFHRRLL